MSSSILEGPTPFAEANWKEIQTGAKYGVSEESLQKDFEASPKSSGSKAKEPKTTVVCDQENEKAAGGASSKYVCEYCCGNHWLGDCLLPYTVTVGATVSPSYFISCNYCGFEVDNDLICPRHKRKVEAHLAPRFCGICDDFVDHIFDSCPNKDKFTTEPPFLHQQGYSDDEYFKMIGSGKYENRKYVEPFSP